VDSVDNVGQYTSIAIDSDGDPHIAYYDATTGVLKHAYMSYGVWITAVRDSSENVGLWTSIAIDSMNKVHISYYDFTNKDLKYVTNSEGFWDIQTVEQTGDVGMYTSIAVDSENWAHISYYDATNKRLMYANNTDGVWVTETVDDSADVGLYTSIAVDSEDIVHIAYYDLTNKDLKYATSGVPGWGPAALDGSGDVGLWTSLVMDSNDKLHIVYYDATNGDLKYTTDSGGVFTTQTVDVDGDVGQYSSIAVDKDDFLHICYHNATDGTLKYATDAWGGWTTSTVTDGVIMGLWNSIGASEDRNVHISTYDATNTALRYVHSMNQLPSAPQDVDTSAGDGYVLLTWDEPLSSGRGTITEYKIYRGTSPLSLALLETVGDVRQYNDTLLENDQTYFYQISAVNTHGEGALSDIVQATPTAEGITPSGPTNLDHEDGDGYVLLTWESPTSVGSSPVIGYRVYRGLTQSTESMVMLDTLEVEFEYNDTTVDNGQTYFYAVRALNSVGWGEWSEVVEAQPQSPNPPTVPGAPQSLQAQGDAGYVNLTWEVPTDNGGSPILGYRVYRGLSAGSVTLLTTLGSGLSFNDTTVSAGETYYYRVSAFNSVGEGGYASISVEAGEGGGEIQVDLWIIAVIVVVIVVIIVIVALFFLKGGEGGSQGGGSKWNGPDRSKPPRSWKK